VLGRLRSERGLSIWMVTHHAEAARGAVDRAVSVAEGGVSEESES